MARAWLNAHFQGWSKNVRKATKHAETKDTQGQVTVQLAHSNIPLKELSETAYREKKETPDLKKWKDPGSEPNPPREIIMALAFLVYDLNKCASSWTEQNAMECATLTEVVKSIAERDDNFLNLYITLPMGDITDEMAKLKRAEALNADNKKAEATRKTLVSGMETLGDLRIILVQLATGAKSEASNPSMASQCHSIAEALDSFDWKECGVGKFLCLVSIRLWGQIGILIWVLGISMDYFDIVRTK